MAGNGPPPTPTALKVLRGNPGQRKLNKKEPKPERGKPAFPEWLSKVERAEAEQIYDEMAELLDRMKVLTKAEQEALSQLADKIAMYRRVRKSLKSGFSYTTTTQTGGEMRRIKPEVPLMLDLSRQIRNGLMDFGLTPASRSKIEAIGVEESDPFKEFLGGGA